MGYVTEFIAKDRARQLLQEADHERLVRAISAGPAQGVENQSRSRGSFIRKLARFASAA